MGRIRTIKPEFWRHEALSELPEFCHMLAAALLNYADDEGYFNANIRLVMAECFPLREPSMDPTVALRELSRIGFIRLGNDQNGRSYGHVVSFRAHQTINKPSKSKISCLTITWHDYGKTTVGLPEDYRGELGTGNWELGTGNREKNSSSSSHASANEADAEDVQDDISDPDQLLNDLLAAVGRQNGNLTPYWLPNAALPHIQRWITDLRLTPPEILAIARQSRQQHGEPPNGPKALDHAMQAAAKAKIAPPIPFPTKASVAVAAPLHHRLRPQIPEEFKNAE